MSRRLLVVLLFLAAAPPFALHLPPKPTQWVNDYGVNLLSAAETQRLDAIQVGYGLEPVITDAYASDVYRNTLVPHFRRRQYYAGIDMAIDRLAARVEPTPAASGRSAVPLRASGERVAEGPVRGATRDPGYACFEIVLVLLGFGGVVAP